MEEKPVVSIIMATFNRAEFIAESLMAIQNQTFKNWECLIIDDGGTDDTAIIIDSIIKKDPRFKFHKRPDKYIKGLPGCRNCGLDKAVGEYIIFFDDDDIAHPQNLEICVSELDNRNIFFCRYIREVFRNDFHYNFDFSSEYSFFDIDYKDIGRMLDNTLQFNSCSVMWKKECFSHNKYVEYLMYAEEWELYARIVSSGFNGISINKTLFYGRKHENSNTGEFYNKNISRRKSYADAIVLAVLNLNIKKMLTNEILRYFVVYSFSFKEFNLFYRIISSINISKVNKLKWLLFYFTLPVRIKLYRLKKKT
jgi:glycosyltransferase involved in cell wall biosynthesis